MAKQHYYRVGVTWTGNTGDGTAGYKTYLRDYTIDAPEKPPIQGSSDPAFRGDKTRWNPEDLLVASLSACHQLWYLHLCADAAIRVLAYRDDARGVMTMDGDGGARFTSVTLTPSAVLAAGSDTALALALHAKANELCFVARSVNFPVTHEPSVQVEAE